MDRLVEIINSECSGEGRRAASDRITLKFILVVLIPFVQNPSVSADNIQTDRSLAKRFQVFPLFLLAQLLKS